MNWSSPQETHTYNPLYLANGTFGGLLDLSGTDMNLWSSQIVGFPENPEGHFGVHFPVTALRTQVYYRNNYFRDKKFYVSRAAILSDDPIYVSNPSMPHKANVYNCKQSLDIKSGIAQTSGTIYLGSLASLIKEVTPERRIPFKTEVLFLKDSHLMSMCLKTMDKGSEIFFDPTLVLEDKFVINNSGNSIYSMGNEMKTDITVCQKILDTASGENWIRYVVRPNNDQPYTIRIYSENGKVTTLNDHLVLSSENQLCVQVEILPQADLRENWNPKFKTHRNIVAEQIKRWQAFWGKSSVSLPSHENLWQERYETSLFYTAQSVSDGPTHPVGLSRPMLPYWFGSFHDTDTYFCRPLLEAGHFELANLNLNFRYRTLKKAFDIAKEMDLPGALYPWEVDPYGNGEKRIVPLNQAIIACEAWHQYLHCRNDTSKMQARAIVEGIFENLLHCVDQSKNRWDLKNQKIDTFSETIDAYYPYEATLAIRATAEAYTMLNGETAKFSEEANRVLKDMDFPLDSEGAYTLVRDGDPEYLRCPSMTLGAWPLRHLPADSTMLKSLEKELSRIVSVFAWMPHQLSALASRLKHREGSTSAYQLLKQADIFYKNWHAFDEWENRRTARAEIFVTAAGGFCTAIHHMLLAETESNTISLFPGIPKTWEDCTFDGLTTPLGWKITAKRSNGKVSQAKAEAIDSTAMPIIIEINNPDPNLKVPEDWKPVSTDTNCHRYQVEFKR